MGIADSAAMLGVFWEARETWAEWEKIVINRGKAVLEDGGYYSWEEMKMGSVSLVLREFVKIHERRVSARWRERWRMYRYFHRPEPGRLVLTPPWHTCFPDLRYRVALLERRVGWAATQW